MEYRPFGRTGMRLSTMALGGLLAHYEAACGHPTPAEKRRIYLRAAELGVNLFDMGYGDEAHIPQELKGPGEESHFSLKTGSPHPVELPAVIERHLRNVRREAIDILRVHHRAYLQTPGLAEAIAALRHAGKVRALCLIRHFRAEQEAYADQGPEPESDADLVIYNYVCRWQAGGMERAAQAGKGVLVMKALGGQWLSWRDMTTTDWAGADEQTIVRLNPQGEGIRRHIPLILPTVCGPWQELADPGETVPRTSRALQWVLRNPAVSSVLVAVARVEELEEVLDAVRPY